MSTYESLKEQRYQHEWVIAGAFPHRLIAVFDASDGWSVRFYAPNGPKSNVTVENRDGEDMSTLTIEQCRGIVELVLLRARSSTNPATMEHLTEMVQERVDLCLREEPGTGDLG